VQNPSELAAVVSSCEYIRELVGVGEAGEELKLVGYFTGLMRVFTRIFYKSPISL